MKKTQEISSFFYSQYFAEGLRITIGTIIPILVCALIGEFMTGTLVSLGALIVGLSDTPGAPNHRKMGMIYCTLLCILTIAITALVNSSLILMTITIAVCSFLFSMFSVFNARAATIGMMCALIMLINVDDVYTLQAEFTYLCYFIIGAIWYMLISFSIMQVRPYRLAQQELSETIVHVADYIRLKANFYDNHLSADDNYLKLIEKQIQVNNHQETVRDILFQSKRSIKDTTKEGRFLTLIFNDIVDLFEQSMTTHYDYDRIRQSYTETGLMDKIRSLIVKIAHELDHIGYKINANRRPQPIYDLDDEIEKLRIAIDEADLKYPINFIPLKKIVINIRAIVKHLQNIYQYSQFKGVDVEKQEIKQAKKFINTEVINWNSFRDNLSLKSTVCRHALRMSIMLSATYLILNLIHYPTFGTYWILLTVLVILKPGFGLTKERNVQRVIGTIIGGFIGAVILMLVPDVTYRFIINIFFFLIAYSLFRVNYIMAVIFMTPYVLIMLSFTGVNTLEMAKERIIDTFIGGTLAFLSGYIIFPNWESFQIKSNMRSLLIANYQYLSQAIKLLAGQEVDITSYKLARKEVYIASANMGSTFQRLITEPKWRQKVTKSVNKFVIMNHVLSSYSATLLTQLHDADIQHFNNEHLKTLYKALAHIEKSIDCLSDTTDNPLELVSKLDKLEVKTGNSDESKLIADQLQFLAKISADLHKISTDFVNQQVEVELNK